MSNKGKASLLPKLRFPEFREADAWRSKELGSVCEVLNNRRRPITGSDREPGPYPYYGASGIVDFVKEFIFDERLLLVGEDGAKWSAFERTAFIVEGKYWVNNHAHVLKPTEINDTLLENYLTMVDLGPFVTGAAPPKLTLGKLKSIPVPVPPSSIEQRKIADCLSSLDELIAAQARKVDALKTHKKGLMQQLFPREGETQPRLRFPEFRDAGEWKRSPLGSLCARIMDGTHFSPKSKEGPRPYLTSKNIRDGRIDLSNLSYISEKEHAEIYSKCPVKLHDVLLTKDGANTGNCTLNDLDFEFSLLSSVAVLRGEPSKLRQDFLFQSILSDTVQSLISESMSGQAITRITLAKIGGFAIPVTSLFEQQRIADCLTFLDNLITAVTQELETLKTHKKGLMQQLFPSAEAVEA
jgi:type I restriction enzyme, S subunit